MRWKGQLEWLERDGLRRRAHRPDLAAGLTADGPLLPVEVELASKSLARLRAILALHASWIAAGKTSAVIYVVRTATPRRPGPRSGAQVGLAPDRNTLRVELLDAVRDAALAARRDSRHRRAERHRRGGDQVMLRPQLVLVDLAITAMLGAGGVGGAWWLRRRTTLSVVNLYLPAAIAPRRGCGRGREPVLVGVDRVAAGRGARVGGGGRGMAVADRRSRCGGGAAQPRARAPVDLAARPVLSAGERVYLRGQGELVRERPWPRDVAFVSMTARRERRSAAAARRRAARRRLRRHRRGQDHHRPAADRRAHARPARRAARLDQKGDQEDVEQMKRLAAAAGVPFILFDSQDPAPIAGSRSGAPPTASPPGAWSRSASQSPTTTTRCAGTWTSSARSCTPPTAGHRRSRS